MLQSGITSLIVFAVTSLLVVALYAALNRGGRQARARLRQAGVSGRAGSPWSGLKQIILCQLPVLGDVLAPMREKERNKFNDRLARAGVNHLQALRLVMGVKAALMLLGPAAGLLGAALGLPTMWAMVLGVFVCTLGMMAPSLWIDWRVSKRRTLLRRGLPDALDMLVMCLEGGLSLNSALQRVRGELLTVHPELTAELNIVEREMMMGLSPGEALRKMGERANLEELRSLASVLLQSERYGASIVKAIRVYADGLRVERQQRVEELAQKAAVKVLFPTLLCIFPAIFVVVLGPAAYQIRTIFTHMK